MDLDDIAPAQASSDEFVLDLDLDSADEEATAVYEPAPAYEAATPVYESTPAHETPMRAFVEPEVMETPAPAYESTYQESSYHSDVREVESDVRGIEPYESSAVPPELTPDPVPVFGETEFPIAGTPEPASSSSVGAVQLSPEMIDAIARRAVELMSDKVIREIAWEVVPDLAELLIKRQLEEKQAK